MSENEAVVEQAPTQNQDNVIYRKWDSDDVVRLRDFSLSSVDSGSFTMKAGTYQKLSIVLGVKKCPWFVDVIDDRVGVSDEIFNRRLKEFRLFPIEEINPCFIKTQEINKSSVSLEEVRKK